MISNIRILAGTNSIYIRFDYDTSQSVNAKGVLCATYQDVTLTHYEYDSSYWGTTYLYTDIYYIDNLQPSTLYYVAPYVKYSNGTDEVAEPVKIYTDMLGSITPTYANSFDENGKCYVTDSDGSQLDWTKQRQQLEECTNRSLAYYTTNGYVPPCKYTAKYDVSYKNGTAAMNSSTNSMLFYGIDHIKTETIIHELSHFMDNSFGGGLSHASYYKDNGVSNSFGFILGKKMQDFCRFWSNSNFGAVACHNSHTTPYSDYLSLYSYEKTAYQDLLHRAGAMFNVVKGKDGFVGISNKAYTTPSYCLDEDYYYKIKSKDYDLYFTDTNSSLLYKEKERANDDDAQLWKLTFNPSNGLYKVTNKKYPNHYLNATSNAITSAITEIQIVPTIYTTTGTIYDFDENGVYSGEDTFAILMKPTTDSTTGHYAYTTSRQCLMDTVSSTFSTTYFKPRLKNQNFVFLKNSHI